MSHVTANTSPGVNSDAINCSRCFSECRLSGVPDASANGNKWSAADRPLFPSATDRQHRKRTGSYRPLLSGNPTFRNRPVMHVPGSSISVSGMAGVGRGPAISGAARERHESPTTRRPASGSTGPHSAVKRRWHERPLISRPAVARGVPRQVKTSGKGNAVVEKACLFHRCPNRQRPEFTDQHYWWLGS